MGAIDDFTFQPSPAPATSLDSGVSMDQVFTGRVLQPSTAQNKENAMSTDVNKVPILSPQQAPSTPKLVKPIRMVETSKKTAELPVMVDLVNWRNPPAAFCMMLAGTAICCTAHYLFGTNEPTLSSVATLLALLLGINFFREAFSATWLQESTWQGSEFEQIMIDRSKDFIKFACFTRDQLLCSDNPFTMLRVRPRDQTFQEYVLPAAKLCVIPFIEILSIPARTCCTLMLVRNLSYYVPIWSMLATFWVGMFVITPFRKQVDEALIKAYGFCTSAWQTVSKKVQLSRFMKVALVAAGLGVPLILTDSISRAMLGLGFLMFIRWSMNEKEVEAWHANKLVKTVAQSPFLRSARHAGQSIGFFADDVLMSAMKSVRNHVNASEHTHSE